MKKIAVVMGTRPEIIKLSPICRALEEQEVEYDVLFTNQHYDTSMNQFLKEFDIQNIIRNNGDVLQFLIQHLPKYTDVVVQGDTRSVFYGALVGKSFNKVVHHIEAGLRTGDFNNPAPEEFYRTEVAKLATYHYCPTEYNKQNLLAEGVNEKNILVCGNTVMCILKEKVELTISRKNRVICTFHRNENRYYVNEVVDCIYSLAKMLPSVEFLLILHPNNILKKALEHREKIKNIHLTEPFDYITMVNVVSTSKVVITDSGGLQEECCYVTTPCIVLRDKTERMEAVDSGNSIVISPKTIKERMFEIKNIIEQSYIPQTKNPYYDEYCIEKIMKVLK